MNKYWIAGVFVASVCAGFVSGCQYRKSIDEKERIEAVAKAQAEALKKTQEMNEEHEAIRQKFEQEQKDAEKTIANLKSRIADGSLRLSVRTKDVCSDTATGDRERRAELDPADAQALISIAEDGDRAIRKLNQCIDQYSAVEGKMR